MSLDAAIVWRWRARRAPPEPRAVVAWGATSRRLLARLKSMDEAWLARLQATASGEVLVVTAELTDALPWIDGAAYAAPCDIAPGLWLPTLHEPDLPIDLIARAGQSRHRRQPLLLWADPPALVPLDRLMPLTPVHLARIEAHWSGGEGSP